MIKKKINFHTESTKLFRENHSVADYVQKWGHFTSVALLDPSCHIFHCPEANGIIGYKVKAGCAIVFGDPVCAQMNVEQLINRFHDYCYRSVKNIVHVSASQQFVTWGLQHKYRTAISIGNEIILDPSFDPKERKGFDASNLRNKCNQAKRLNIIIKEHLTDDPHIERDIENVARSWLQGRKGLQIYLLQIDLFAHRSNKRWFYAQQNDEIIGVLMLNKLDSYQGWYLNMLMTTQTAPPITSEVLVLSALDALRLERCNFVTIGTLASSALETVIGLSHAATWFAKNTFKLITTLFKLHSRQWYWKKFQPQTAPSFLLGSNQGIGIREIVGIMGSLNAGRPS